MDQFYGHIRNRDRTFSIQTNTRNPKEWVRDLVLSYPAEATSIAGFRMSALGIVGNLVCSFNVSYKNVTIDYPVFLVRDAFELRSAISVGIKQRMRDLHIVVDNKTRFFPLDTEGFDRELRLSGEELFFSQQEGYHMECAQIEELDIVIVTVTFSCFDSPKEINDLNCYLFEEASRIKSENESDRQRVIALSKWFADNVEYKKTGQVSDHSAVGLVKNGTAVCQGIAAAAGYMLRAMGIQSRYVTGIGGDGLGGGGSHGWNMVKLDGEWTHIDYTFALSNPDFLNRLLFIQPREVFALDHRWDESEFSPEKSDETMNVADVMSRPVLMLVPDGKCCAVNGAMLDTTYTHPMYLRRDGVELVSVLDVISLYGGSYVRRGDKMASYIGDKRYEIPMENLMEVRSVMYCEPETLGNMGYVIGYEGELLVVRR